MEGEKGEVFLRRGGGGGPERRNGNSKNHGRKKKGMGLSGKLRGFATSKMYRPQDHKSTMKREMSGKILLQGSYALEEAN